MSENENRFLECHICYEKYDSHSCLPYMANCGHSACKFCFENMLQRGIDKCHCGNSLGEAKPNKLVIAILDRLDQIQAEHIAIRKSVLRMCPEDQSTTEQSSSSREDTIQNASVFVEPFFGPQAQRRHLNERQNPYPAEAFRRLSMLRMNYKRNQ